LVTINVPGLWSILIKGRRTTLALTSRVADLEPPNARPVSLRPQESAKWLP
jgi:hypothetical protein